MKTYTQEIRERLASIFTEAMEKRGILPKDPWRCSKTELWLDSLGCKMHPCRQYGYVTVPNVVDYRNNMTFWVQCGESKVRTRKLKPIPWMLIEAPRDVACRVLALGFVS